MMILALLALASDGSAVIALLAEYRDKTRAEYRCAQSQDPGEIMVCGARRADRYRVPLVIADSGDPRHEGVFDAAERLQAKTTPCQDKGPFLIGCGMVGVTMSTNNRGTKLGGVRPLAP